ncbi:unnamed protein product [Caenorhabditis angaria]|uniref:ELMO domain-containing protein n=1 Tax=Caenorhabditis angaria TaxID=860376 RepID=A0A9P1II80_9PELO|nr:unnamed protein product [Caenorhabditis angaria]
MENDGSDDEREKWNKERERVLDEWSEIELKGKEVLTMPDIITEPGVSSLTFETPLEELYPLLVSIEQSDQPTSSNQESEEQNPTITTFDRIMQICLCRPAKASSHPLIYTHKTLAVKLSQVGYDNENGTHWLILSDYFQTVSQIALNSSNVNCPRIGSHWQIVGFQGTNPATDFRGCGIFALLQLHSFTQRLPHNILKAIVQLSRAEPNDFPLAVVSINITGLILGKLKKDRFDLLGTPSNGLYPVLVSLHSASLAYFCAQYKSQNLTLAQCQTLLSEIDQMLEKSPNSLLSLLENNNDKLIKQLL